MFPLSPICSKQVTSKAICCTQITSARSLRESQRQRPYFMLIQVKSQSLMLTDSHQPKCCLDNCKTATRYDTISTTTMRNDAIYDNTMTIFQNFVLSRYRYPDFNSDILLHISRTNKTSYYLLNETPYEQRSSQQTPIITLLDPLINNQSLSSYRNGIIS